MERIGQFVRWGAARLGGLAMHEAFLTKRDLYLAAIGPLCKIGVSRRPKRRVTGLSQTQPHRANLIKVWPKVGHLEPMVHSILEPLQQRSEWSKCSLGFAEWVCEEGRGRGQVKWE